MVINIKTVGIILREFNENNKHFIGTRNDLFKTLTEFNLNIIGIPINNKLNNIINTINMCDGLILPGGDNITNNDYAVIDYLYRNDIPTLGICLGMQTMALYFSNIPEKSLKNHYSSQNYVHYVTIAKDSLLFKILKKERIMVNSRHHSFIPKTKASVNATSNGLIEGIEAKNKKFFLGIEWHPESLNDTNSYQIFKHFIDIL